MIHHSYHYYCCCYSQQRQETDSQLFRTEAITTIQEAIALGIEAKYADASVKCERFLTKIKAWLDSSTDKRSKAHQRMQG